MKKSITISLLLLSSFLKAQQWEWAVTADSVSGNQEVIKITKNESNLFILLNQTGMSVIHGTHLSAGSVLLKMDFNGNILLVKNLPGSLKSIYPETNGNVLFIGIFSDTLNFTGTTLVSHGASDILFGELDPEGNKIWVSTAGSVNPDAGNDIITDAQGNLFIAGQMSTDYYTGSQLNTGNTGWTTYLLQCDLNGNLIKSYRDSIYDSHPIHHGLELKKNNSGNVYLSASFDLAGECEYNCNGEDIVVISPFSYTLNPVTTFGAYEYVSSWLINPDLSVSANFNTDSHYGMTYTLFRISGAARLLRKEMGWGYDGKNTPFITRGIDLETIVGGTFDRCFDYTNIDTLHYDDITVIPDTLSNIMIAGISASNQFTWLLRSYGPGNSRLAGVISGGDGYCYSAGIYNLTLYSFQDPAPDSLALGTHLLPAENNYCRFFVAGASTSPDASVASKTNSPRMSVYPNPAANHLIVAHSGISVTKAKILDINGVFILDYFMRGDSELTIDISGIKPGIYFLEVTGNDAVYREKFVVLR